MSPEEIAACGSGFDTPNADPAVDTAHTDERLAADPRATAADLAARGGSVATAIVDGGGAGARLELRVTIPASGTTTAALAGNLSVAAHVGGSAETGRYRIRAAPGPVRIAKLDPIVTLDVAAAEKEVYAGALRVRAGFGTPPESTAELLSGELEYVGEDEVEDILFSISSGVVDCRRLPAIPTPEDFSDWNANGYPTATPASQVDTPAKVEALGPTSVLMLTFPGDPGDPAVVLTFGRVVPDVQPADVRWNMITRDTRGYTCTACSGSNSLEGCRWCDWVHYALHRDTSRPYRVLTVPGRHQLAHAMTLDNRLTVTLAGGSGAIPIAEVATETTAIALESESAAGITFTVSGLERTAVHAATVFPTFDVLVPGMARLATLAGNVTFEESDVGGPEPSAPPREWLWTDPGTVGDHCGQFGVAHFSFHYVGCDVSPRDTCVVDIGALRAERLGSHPFPFPERLRGVLRDPATGEQRDRSRIVRAEQQQQQQQPPQQQPALKIALEYEPRPVVVTVAVPVARLEFREPELEACTLRLSAIGAYAGSLGAGVTVRNVGDEDATAVDAKVTCGSQTASAQTVSADNVIRLGHVAEGALVATDTAGATWTAASVGLAAANGTATRRVDCVAVVTVATRRLWSSRRKSVTCSASIDAHYGRFADPCSLTFPQPEISASTVDAAGTIKIANAGTRSAALRIDGSCDELEEPTGRIALSEEGESGGQLATALLLFSEPAGVVGAGSTATVDLSALVPTRPVAGTMLRCNITVTTTDVDATQCWSARATLPQVLLAVEVAVPATPTDGTTTGSGSSSTPPGPGGANGTTAAGPTPSALAPGNNNDTGDARQAASSDRGSAAGNDGTGPRTTWLGSIPQSDMIVYTTAMAAGALIVIVGGIVAARSYDSSGGAFDDDGNSSDGEEANSDAGSDDAEIRFADDRDVERGAARETTAVAQMYEVTVPLPPRNAV
jgi:hypothetical protein